MALPMQIRVDLQFELFLDALADARSATDIGAALLALAREFGIEFAMVADAAKLGEGLASALLFSASIGSIRLSSIPWCARHFHPPSLSLSRT